MTTEPQGDVVKEGRALLNKATPGPWLQSHLAAAYIVGPKDLGFYVVASVGEYEEDGSPRLLFNNAKGNLALIAVAPGLIARLCDELEVARSLLNDTRVIAAIEAKADEFAPIGPTANALREPAKQIGEMK